VTTDLGLEIGPGYPHGSNLSRKLKSTGKNAPRAEEVAVLYKKWRKKATETPYIADKLEAFAQRQTKLFDDYRNALDREEYDDAFDSRGALQSSALEEFCRYLLEPVVAEALPEPPDDAVALGHFNVYQGMFFTAESFREFGELPTPHFPKVNMDFVIAKQLNVVTSTSADASSDPIFLPAVAIECKTYLDRTRYHGADGNATMVKGGFPGCLYIVVAEMLKLDLGGVNVHGSRIDHIYILRKARNIDLKTRRAEGIALKPVDADAVLDLMERVRAHLLDDWSQPEQWEETGRLK
jgi:hypothetical protein